MDTITYIKKALYFAAEKHDGQYRKGTRVPYIVHPVLVALAVKRYTDDEEIFIAALLHDVLEDSSDVSPELLQEEFGYWVARIVAEVSHPREKKYSSWKEKKEMYLDRIKSASLDALIVVGADKMVNMQAYFDAFKKDGGEHVIAKHFNATSAEYFWYYDAVGDILDTMLHDGVLAREYRELLDGYRKTCER